MKDFNSIIFFASETHMMNGEVETDENIPAEEVGPEVSNIFLNKKKVLWIKWQNLEETLARIFQKFSISVTTKCEAVPQYNLLQTDRC